MARSRRFTVRLKRVRTGKTNYKSRLKTLSSKKIRLVIRKKLNILIAQFIKYEVKGDRVITSATTKDLRKFGWNCHAVLKGVIDSGLKIPVNEEILPSEERVSGKHIQDYCSKIKGTDNYNRQFSGYLKNKVNPDEITKNFEEVKRKIGAK
nr:50S ribosomal protein L18P [uncultured archaeon]